MKTENFEQEAEELLSMLAFRDVINGIKSEQRWDAVESTMVTNTLPIFSLYRKDIFF